MLYVITKVWTVGSCVDSKTRNLILGDIQSEECLRFSVDDDNDAILGFFNYLKYSRNKDYSNLYCLHNSSGDLIERHFI